IIVGTARATRKLGYHWQREGSNLFSRPVLPDPTSVHIVDQYVDVARALGARADRAEFVLAPFEEDVHSVRTNLAAKGWDGRPLALFNAGAGWATKRWSAAKFAQLADRIVAEGAAVAFLGAPSDRSTLEEVRAHGAQSALDMVGETSV